MGRPRKPTALLEAGGAFKNHPARRRTGEPDTGRGIGEAPDHLADDERACWDEIVRDTAPRLFQSSDRPAMELLARFLAESRRRGCDFATRKVTLMLTIMQRFGMTPSDRAKLTLPSGGEENNGRPKSGLASFRRAA